MLISMTKIKKNITRNCTILFLEVQLVSIVIHFLTTITLPMYALILI